MAFTKKIALHDEIKIDGTDFSNDFRTFGLSSEDSDVDVSGFSATGNDESLSGTRAQGFEGEAFYTEEAAAILWALHNNRTIFQVQWTPGGLLVTSGNKTYYGMCQLRSFNPNDTRGDVQVMTCTFKTANAAGITQGTGT